MSKWVKNIFISKMNNAGENHISTDDMAQLIDGTIPPKKRETVISHVDHCTQCYELMNETLADIPDVRIQSTPEKRGLKRISYLTAASVIFIFLAAGSLLYHHQRQPRIHMASLSLTPDFQSILLENESLTWNNRDRIERFKELLNLNGIKANALNRIVLNAPYFASKNFRATGEIINIRIEKDTAYIEIIAVKSNNHP